MNHSIRSCKEFRLYKGTLNKSTKGKFKLVDSITMEIYLNKGSLIAEKVVKYPDDVEKCRQIIESNLPQFDIDSKRIKKLILASSEAATNMVKHGEQGMFKILFYKDCIKIVFSDKGPGIPISNIPDMIFKGGRSTKNNSLGYGFYLIYRLVEKIIMNVSICGLTLVFEEKVSD